MDKHSPWHSWRDFLREYVIVVIGVLTALAAEQTAEAINHRSDANEARRSLNGEVAYNLSSLAGSTRQQDCGLQRLDELIAWHASLENGAPLKLVRAAWSPTYQSFDTNVWRVASPAGVAQMNFDERLAYGELYDILAASDSIRESMRHHWEELEELSGAKALSQEVVHRPGGDIRALRHEYGLFRGNADDFRKKAEALGVTALPATALIERSIVHLCQSLLKP